MRTEVIPSYHYQRQRWKNDLGWTCEIHREGGADDFAWRASIADIDHDCDFSAFPGLQRSLVLVHGGGMRLRFADGEHVEILPPHGRIDFDGARALHCELLEGPTQDFNLMWRPERCNAVLQHRPLVGSMVFFTEADSEWLIFVLSGWAEIRDGEHQPKLEAGDSLRLRPGEPDRHRVLLHGGGEILTIKITYSPA